MPKDDLDIEFDEDVEKVLADPKAGLLKKTFDYWSERKAKEVALAQKKQEQEKPAGIFGGLFS